MALAKLHIQPLPPSELAKEYGEKGIAVLFNPKSYSITKTVRWDPPRPPGKNKVATHTKLNAPGLKFGGGGSRQLTLDLFYDVTEDPKTDDVRKETNKIVALTRIWRKEKHPPVCQILWGEPMPEGSDFPFKGVVTNLTQRFTLFSSDGKPVRAILNVVFKEFLPAKEDLKKTDPELTTHVVKRGDTLSGIAAELYRDPTRWRLIAQANDLNDPRQLQIGQRLTIPEA